jgi:hypothetical protein
MSATATGCSLPARSPALAQRSREQHHHLQMERLESLQALLGAGWWEVFSDRAEVQLAPSLPLR